MALNSAISELALISSFLREHALQGNVVFMRMAIEEHLYCFYSCSLDVHTPYMFTLWNAEELLDHLVALRAREKVELYKRDGDFRQDARLLLAILRDRVGMKDMKISHEGDKTYVSL